MAQVGRNSASSPHQPQLRPYQPASTPRLPELRLIAWELTGACNLKCVHCRASAVERPLPDEFSTDEAIKLINEIAGYSSPILILTGGEPLLREDIFEIAAYGSKKNLRVVMGSNGTLITSDVAKKLRKAGVQRVAISIESANPKLHDEFRQIPDAFHASLEGIEHPPFAP